MPPVSVIIPAYNAERWLPETLASVAAQEVQDLEVIIIDDGSTDGTADYVHQQWPQFQLISTENRGVSHARNLGTSLATGEFIQYLDADDLLLTGKIGRQLSLFAAHPEVDVIYSNWQRLISREDDSFAPGEKIQRRIEDVHPDPEIAFFTDMWCPTGAYLYRRRFLDKVLPWKEWLPVIQDARFALDCAMAGARWLHDPEVSVLYRQHHSGSVSTRSQLAFTLDRLANAEDVSRLWQSHGEMSVERRQTLIDAFAGLARGLYDLDRFAFKRAYHAVLQLDPQFHPKNRWLSLLSRLLGYPTAEAVASFYRRLKTVC